MHPAISEGRGAVITGGASGIGLATAERLLAAGMRVAIADRNEEALDAARTKLGGEVLTLSTDVSELSAVETLCSTAFDAFGDVAFLMNNAGTGGGGGAFANIEGWQRVLGVNLWGVINGLQTFHPAND